MQPIHIFTSITANYIPKARVLAASVKRFHPDAQFHLVLSDVIPQWLVLENEPFDSIITIEELSIPDLKSWIFKHSIVEMCTGVKGFAFKEIIRRYNCDNVLYFDPDMVIFSKLDGLVENLNNSSILLTPHQTKPEEFNEAVIDNEICSLKHGVFNLGFLGIKSSEEGKRFLDWWSNRCLNFCYDDIPGGLFTDQRWVDLAPAFFTDLYVLRNPIYNVATWNLTHRIATGSLEQGILINNEPLCFYHFSGFDSGAQEIMLKKYGSSSPVLFSLRKWYIQQCDQMGQSEFGQIPCFYSYFDNEQLISKQQRSLYRHRLDLQKAFPNPFSTTDANHSYFNWYAHHGQDEFGNQPINFSELQQIYIQCQADLEQAQALIRGMESSKFWKLREVWFQLKRLTGLTSQALRSLQKGIIGVKASLKQKQSFLLTAKISKNLKEQPIQNLAYHKKLPILKIDSPTLNSSYTGLIALSGNIFLTDTDILNSRLEISLDERDWISIKTCKINPDSLVSAEVEKTKSFHAVINSFLLPQGINTIHLSLKNSLGEELTNSKISFRVDNTGSLAESVYECLKNSNATPVLQGMLDSSDFPYSDCKVVAWFDRPDAIEHIPHIIDKYCLPESFIQHLTDFVNLGYISLDEFIPLELVIEANTEIDSLIANSSVSYVTESGERIEHLFEKSTAVRKIWTYPSVIQILSALFDDIAIPCQTLNFLHGSQQAVHQDTIHLTPFPQGYMCGVWVALEDISSDAGPLFAYPKSHKLSVLYAKTVGIDKVQNYWNQHLIDEYAQKYLPTLKSYLSNANLEPMNYTPKAGSVFIWHANLAHGGSPRNVQSLTRKSMVSHYFARGAIAFYDTTGTVGYKHDLS